MNRYYYSALTNAFYPSSLKLDYENSENGWPDDVVAISDEVYVSLLEGRASGKVIVADENGKPVLSNPPPPTHEELVAISELKRNVLLSEATVKITPLQDAVDIGIAVNDEISMLREWKKYRVLLSRVDVNNVQNIEWPEQPK
ncbi:tail fiber assembly protein [Serratia surfactantfaciens]|uniref:tail fiber assembly protein n=1 Tax=Serratia surfactantfaciens TaxID=2741499 RepID=UPI001B3C4EC7|nr:tail fiber assembly protein [Serratia surfactantfaciens]